MDGRPELDLHHSQWSVTGEKAREPIFKRSSAEPLFGVGIWYFIGMVIGTTVVLTGLHAIGLR